MTDSATLEGAAASGADIDALAAASLEAVRPAPPTRPLNIAVVGAGPVGLALAVHAARMLPTARITLFDARPLDKDVSGDGRTLAMSLGSVQWLERLGAWPADKAQPITQVHVSQQPSGFAYPIGEPKVLISAADLKVPMLGAALSYGEIVTPLQRVWTAAVEKSGGRLTSRFGCKVQGMKAVTGGVEIDAGAGLDGPIDAFDLAVVAEGSVMAERNAEASSPTLRHDYRQTAWVGQVTLDGIAPGMAFERFTSQGPAALLPLKGSRAALVWCVASDADPVRDLTDAQRIALLETVFHRDVGHITSITPLKHFPLALNAQRSMVSRLQGGRVVHIGNAAQTLHPVAGQGLNLGLRDAFELVRSLALNDDVPTALRRVEWKRGPDRWTMIAATDFLARSFTWPLPGLSAARGIALAAFDKLGPVKARLAKQMMFGSR